LGHEGASGKVLECGIYRTAAGIEGRCGYGPDDLLRSQLAPEIGTACGVAEQWRRGVLAKGGFTWRRDMSGTRVRDGGQPASGAIEPGAERRERS
jgi:hypothetical protein